MDNLCECCEREPKVEGFDLCETCKADLEEMLKKPLHVQEYFVDLKRREEY